MQSPQERYEQRIELAKNIPQAQNKDGEDISIFGDKGKYSKFAEEQYRRVIKLFGFTKEMAIRHGKQAASDFGATQKTSVVDGKVGAVGKNGDVVTKEMAEGSGKCTPSLLVVIACQYAEKAGKNGLSFGHTDWQLDKTNAMLSAYLEKIQEPEVREVAEKVSTQMAQATK